MQLTDLLKDIVAAEIKNNCEITGLAQDSRQVKPGNLFFAYPGLVADGRDFINDAITRGAAAILMDVGAPLMGAQFQDTPTGYPVIPVTNLASQMGKIAARFYQYPSRQLDVIGVTGTNGKTSCTQLLAHALHLAEKSSGIIGTMGYGLLGHLQDGALTTPDALELQKLLADFHIQQARYVSMEISSHRLAQNRINGLDVKIAVFTNLSRDHLDYHGDMQHYAAAKRSLFDLPGLGYGVLNADDLYGQTWLQELADKLPVYAYSLEQPKAELQQIPHVYTRNARFDAVGFTASVCTPWGDGVLHNPYLIGRFNLSNLLAVLTVLGILGMPLEETLKHLANLHGVPGRMETFGGNGKPLLVIDYSHTPDALEHVLKTLRQDCRGKLWCVFGCGGNRDKGKRPVMGKIAQHYADHVVITDDNPRHEIARDIVADIIKGLDGMDNVVIEHDRRRAIRHAVLCAQPEDIVLIAGKGHETYQIIGDEKLPFSDALEAKLLLAEIEG